jgi:hypothetical protein
MVRECERARRLPHSGGGTGENGFQLENRMLKIKSHTTEFGACGTDAYA